jgi:glycosyltransferase involved in cell wall biosynthesis
MPADLKSRRLLQDPAQRRRFDLHRDLDDADRGTLDPGRSRDIMPPDRPARLKLNIFSPLPPVRSEIANVTCQIAAALQKLADVTLWTAQDEPPELPEPPAGLPPLAVQRFDPAQVPWPLVQQADLNIYNIGNNATFHRAIFDVARQAPGVVVLHDTRLQHFFARYSETPGADRDFYLDSMRRSHGLEGLAGARAWLAREQTLDTLVERYPMTLAAMDGALAAVIHNDAEQDALAEQSRTPIFMLPLAFTGRASDDCTASAGPLASDGAPDPDPGRTLRLIAFGFMGFNRRLGSVLDAIAGHPDSAVELDIYGVLEDADAILERTASLGLSERVRQHGFVPEAELTAALARADLALNLRYPSMGEASASQLRIWDAGLPSLVTRTEWYGTLPEDAVFFVEPDDEVAGIRGHLSALRTSPARFRRAGLRGRQVLLERHTPADYARGLLAIARELPILHARREGVAMSRMAANGLMAIADFAGIGLCADRVAEAVRALTQPR